ELRARIRDAQPPRPVPASPFVLIAEVKLASPSEGRIAPPNTDDAASAVEQASTYSAAGAAAISVLTEPHSFGGSLAHLAAVSAATDTPTMRKDFLVEPIQLLEARACGASGALLIARMLDDDALRAMLDEAAELGLFVLLECFDERDCERAAAALATRPRTPEVLVGINTRDLSTLRVRDDALESLVNALPTDRRRVAESGIRTAEDARRAATLGYDLALVGTALMRSGSPTELAAAMLVAGELGAAERPERAS
ncbi:MAG: indole-3-glycerol phosphate synthase TrpC, partial [Phycisphaerales bacterium]